MIRLKHTHWKLFAAWGMGIGGGDMLAWIGSRYDGPYRLVAGLWMLLIGIAVWKKWYAGKIDVFSTTRWWVGLTILSVILLLPIIGGLPSFQFELNRSTLISFLWCTVVIGGAEELWWRGIWFEMWKGKPIISILAGSLAFTAYHFPFQGSELMIGSGLAIRIFFLGLVFAAARYQGASISVLALAHGLIDWAQGQIQWQREPGLLLFAICSTLIMTIILATKRNNQIRKHPQGALS